MSFGVDNYLLNLLDEIREPVVPSNLLDEISHLTLSNEVG